MLSIEEIKLLISTLRKLKKHDFKQLINDHLDVLIQLEKSIETFNQEMIENIDNTTQWYRHDLDRKLKDPFVDEMTRRQIQLKIFQFGRSNIYNSLEIGPGTGMFSKDFRAWRLNYFLDVLRTLENDIRQLFTPLHQKYLKFYTTDKTECSDIPANSCNFVFSWDTFVFFTQEHIAQYLRSINRVLIDGAYGFIHYADCHFEVDMNLARRGYWKFNTKSAMTDIIQNAGYEVVEMNMFKPGANYAIFRKPGKQNPVVYKISELTLD